MSVDAPSPALALTGGAWWAAYEDGDRHFVVPVVGFDEHGLPFVWSAETHMPAAAVRTGFVGLVSDHYRGEFGDVIGKAIKQANAGHRGEAFAQLT